MPNSTLLIDEQTLRDLEIFEGREGRAGLFSTLECAKTRGGAAVLRQRFLHPLSSPEDIRAVHESVRYVLEHRAVFSKLPSQYAVSGFERYFHRTLTAPVTGRRVGLALDMLTLRVDTPHDYTEIHMGVGHAVSLVNWFRAVAAMVQDDAPRGEIAAYLREVSDVVSAHDLSWVPAKQQERWRFWTVLQADRVVRGAQREAFARLLRLLYEIDALVALATAGDNRGFVPPEVLEGTPRIEAHGLYHPFLQTPVRNPLTLSDDKRMLFLTGPNMAGKTTYLRSCGVAVYLAHVGMAVPAERFAFVPAQAFFTAISLSDDVRAGISFFQAEARRARAISEALANGLRVIAIMDEPFKGTNVKDALDASCDARAA